MNSLILSFSFLSIILAAHHLACLDPDWGARTWTEKQDDRIRPLTYGLCLSLNNWITSDILFLSSSWNSIGGKVASHGHLTRHTDGNTYPFLNLQSKSTFSYHCRVIKALYDRKTWAVKPFHQSLKVLMKHCSLQSKYHKLAFKIHLLYLVKWVPQIFS